MPRRLVKSLAALVLITLSINTTALACGPFSVESVFVFTVHPAFPLERYARGEIGVVQPSYARSYLVVAYRHLANKPFSVQEQQTLAELWNERLNNVFDLGDQEWVKGWTDARQKVVGVTPPPQIDVYRSREKPNEYETYLNCQKDSFDNAVATLNERMKKYGADNAVLRGWVEAQDKVFANCSEGRNLPTSLASDSDQLARADRDYQIAAANFYSSDFDEAGRRFEAIASDSSSPWQATASYMVARTLLRKASLGAAETKKESLAKSETQLTKVLGDNKLSSIHTAASRLLSLVRLRLRPDQRLHELAQNLANKTSNDNLKQDLWDYTLLFDQVAETEQTGAAAIPRQAVKRDDLSDWISTLQQTSNEATQHALTRWQTNGEIPWLIASLSKIDGKHERAQDLVENALKIKSTTPAFASSRFHAVRLLIDAGKISEARTILDELLQNHREQLDASSLNLLLSQRMMIATTLPDFLKYAARVPATLSWNDDGREIPTDPGDLPDNNKQNPRKPFFDAETAKAFNSQIPLSVLKEAVKMESLPVHLRQDLAQAVWIRAVLLGDYKTADDVAPILKSLAPSLATQLDAYLNTNQAEAKKFAALYTWLKSPGIEPVVDIGISRSSALNEQDSYRDNWWCSASYNPPSSSDSEGAAQSFTNSGIAAPLFLTEAQGISGTKEATSLNAVGTIPNYLSRQVIQWANSHPSDARVPEALHLAVASTRYGCTDKETGKWSKAAFDLLHRKYPKTTWAQKTKYWFKE